MKIEKSLLILRCPDCQVKLNRQKNYFVCGKCSKKYLIKNDQVFFLKPIKINLKRFFRGHTSYQPKSPKNKIIKKLLQFYYPSLRDRHIDWLKKSKAGRGLVLNLGGGEECYGFHQEINLDYLPFSKVKVVANAEKTPFANNSFDLVLVDSLLEHLLNPQKVVAEIFRILKKGGMVYARTDFIQRYHPVPGDYYRWTLTGIEHLFADFKTIKKGVNSGPWSVFVGTNIGLWRLISQGKKWLFWLGLIFIFPILTAMCPLFRLISKEHESVLASSFYYIGKKE